MSGVSGSGLVGRQLDTVVRATGRNNIWVGSIRAGKTVASVAAWIDYVVRTPVGSIHGIVGKTAATVQRNIIVENLRPKLGKNLVERRGFVEVYGRRCEIFGANDERSVDKVLGVTLWSVCADQIETWSENYFRTIQGRLSPRGARLFGTANPASPYHWLKRVVDRDDVNLFTLTMDDNPHLSEEYVVAAKREMLAAGPAFYGRYILGEWVAAEGQVYNFEGAVVDDMLSGWTGLRVIGVDVGTSVPTAFVELRQGDDGVVYVTRELYWDPTSGDDWDPAGGVVPRLTDDEQVAMLLKWMDAGGEPRCEVYVDPAAASFRVALMQQGVVPYGGSRHLADIRVVMKGISRVQSHFSDGSLLVLRSCGKLIGELAGYSWDEKQTEKGLDRPLKVDDHACDALRYAVMGAGRRLWDGSYG